MDFEIKDGVLRKYTGDAPDVIIPDNINCIGDSAFRGRKDIKSVVIPQSVLTIESWAFAECEALESVQIAGKVTLEKGVFYRCFALKELVAPYGFQEIGNCSFLGCKSLKSDVLNDARFELWTLTGTRNLDKITYPNDEDVCRKSYSWEDYQRITSEVLNYALIYSTEEYNELEGPEIPTVCERNGPITDDLILVKDGHFFGCLLEAERVFYGAGRHCQKTPVILKPSEKSIRIFYQDGSHMPFYMYEQTDACLRRYDDRDNWVEKLFSSRKFVVDMD